eukprot:CAMPEP_0202380652 /NCGR_PEP_ID=MMETSP1127-20130417/30052_1 /ASSEMBLY_ACC=CAM_ASM_000462 /TAXON_ID=3047 /ORGANISM="Dunaliella tertiolecta, Strain CCMP1320" /LENGTH=175 /DNA_ID=CAMNT_0048979395 /DNA_START=179 /DNA_END=704 /DNA_ORIENTATION=-
MPLRVKQKIYAAGRVSKKAKTQAIPLCSSPLWSTHTILDFYNTHGSSTSPRPTKKWESYPPPSHSYFQHDSKARWMLSAPETLSKPIHTIRRRVRPWDVAALVGLWRQKIGQWQEGACIQILRVGALELCRVPGGEPVLRDALEGEHLGSGQIPSPELALRKPGALGDALEGELL